MKRRWPELIWIGLLMTLVGAATFPLFMRFEATRDLAWPNFLLLAAGNLLTGLGLRRAWRKPQEYRGKVAGSIISGISLLAIAFFVLGIFIAARVPSSADVPAPGSKAPAFSLPDQNGKTVALAELLAARANDPVPKPKGALLIFYRGYW